MSPPIEKTLRKAESFIKLGQLDLAESLLKEILKKFPKNKRAIQIQQKLKSTNESTKATHTELPQKNLQDLMVLLNQNHFKELLLKAHLIVGSFPKSAILLNLMGAANTGLKRYETAILNYQTAIQIDPLNSDTYNNMGNSLREKGDLFEAIKCYQRALKIKPDFALVHKNLGISLVEIGDFDAAIESYEKAINIKPKYTQVYVELGNVLKLKGNLNAAIEAYQRFIQIEPNNAEMNFKIGNALRDKGDLEAATESYQKALKTKPDYSEVHNNMGLVLEQNGDLDAALESLKKAIIFNPYSSEININIGNILKNQGKLDCASEYYNTALRINPSSAPANLNLGVISKIKGDLEKSIEYCRKALTINPNYAEAHFNEALALLLLEDFKSGWSKFEWRFNWENNIGKALETTKPAWQPGERKRVLLWGEQGLGDQVVFASLIMNLYALSSKLIIQIEERLIPLFKRSFPNDITFCSQRNPVPEVSYDVHISMGSLAKYFRPSRDSFKQTSKGWLAADKSQVSCLRSKILSCEFDILFGLSWDTATPSPGAENETINLSDIVKVLSSQRVKLVNLQYGDVANQMAALKRSLGIEMIEVLEIDKKEDLDGLATLISACDQVLTIDNVTAHLAGALGKKTHVLLPYSCDWRWGQKRNNSYWYESVRVYRQTRTNDWSDLLKELKI